MSVPSSAKITPQLFLECFKPRKKKSHKGTYGHVLTIAGSKRKIGAALMCARAALRAGAGLSTLALPECAYRKIDPCFSEIMFEPQEDDGEFFSSPALPSLLKLISQKSVLACGPGLGVSDDLKKLILAIIHKIKMPCVLDADALNCLSPFEFTSPIHSHAPLILTPHPGEMSRLLGKKTKWISHREKTIVAFAKQHQVYLALKGHRTLVVTPQGKLYMNTTGNPGMATGGAGDVLTGAIAGFIAQKFPVEKAVLAGVWIHGRAGDWVAKEKGERGMLAWDIAEKIPFVMKELADAA